MTIPLSNIKPNSWNPNEMTEEEYKELVAELTHLGKPAKPIVLRRLAKVRAGAKVDEYEIVDGEHNYRALKELGHTELKDGWFEITECNDAEAMRQTYKRNLGGTNNPIKLGLMFDRALRDTGKSNRDLAKEWELSEGTIRNYLQYAKLGQLRNDYANLTKLSIEQVRLYFEIVEYSKPIADFWLYCGANKDALIIWSNTSYDENTQNYNNPIDFILFKDITDAGFDKILHTRMDTISDGSKWWVGQFKEGIKKAHKLLKLKRKLEQAYCWGIIGDDSEGKKKAQEYIDFYFQNIQITGGKIPQDVVDVLFKMVITLDDNNERQFLLTLDEMKECLIVKKNYEEIIDKAKILIAKKYDKAPSEIKTSWGSLENELDELEIAKRAPDYVKDVAAPAALKLAFINFDFKDAPEDVHKATFERLMMMARGGGYSHGEFDEEWTARRAIVTQLQAIIAKKGQLEEEEKIKNSTEIEIARMIVEKLKCNVQWPDVESFIKRISGCMDKSELYFFYCLSKKYQLEDEQRKSLQKLSSDIMKLRGGQK